MRKKIKVNSPKITAKRNDIVVCYVPCEVVLCR